MHFKGVFAKTDLLQFVEGQVTPGHFHWDVRSLITSEELVKLSASVIDLFIWRLDIDGILAEAFRRFAGVPFIPAFSDGLHYPFEFGS